LLVLESTINVNNNSMRDCSWHLEDKPFSSQHSPVSFVMANPSNAKFSASNHPKVGMGQTFSQPQKN
jgi:hypothetical protein